jgi:hypothetical protein
MVFHDDNCYADYGGEDKDVKSVFPVDYSQCDSGGCSMMRFYWLAFQGVDDETVWQVYSKYLLTGMDLSVYQFANLNVLSTHGRGLHSSRGW